MFIQSLFLLSASVFTAALPLDPQSSDTPYLLPRASSMFQLLAIPLCPTLKELPKLDIKVLKDGTPGISYLTVGRSVCQYRILNQLDPRIPTALVTSRDPKDKLSEDEVEEALVLPGVYAHHRISGRDWISYEVPRAPEKFTETHLWTQQFGEGQKSIRSTNAYEVFKCNEFMKNAYNLLADVLPDILNHYRPDDRSFPSELLTFDNFRFNSYLEEVTPTAKLARLLKTGEYNSDPSKRLRTRKQVLSHLRLKSDLPLEANEEHIGVCEATQD